VNQKSQRKKKQRHDDQSKSDEKEQLIVDTTGAVLLEDVINQQHHYVHIAERGQETVTNWVGPSMETTQRNSNPAQYNNGVTLMVTTKNVFHC
jgi:hypothetical protein